MGTNIRLAMPPAPAGGSTRAHAQQTRPPALNADSPQSKHDILQVILQYMRDEGFSASVMTIQDEARVRLPCRVRAFPAACAPSLPRVRLPGHQLERGELAIVRAQRLLASRAIHSRCHTRAAIRAATSAATRTRAAHARNARPRHTRRDTRRHKCSAVRSGGPSLTLTAIAACAAPTCHPGP